MIRLASVIEQFERDFFKTYRSKILPSHQRALTALKSCRTRHSPKMLMQCNACDHQTYVPHSCGHRNCPHCQHHESQQWIERQLQKQLPGDYFMITFTLPKQLRGVTWHHQKAVYQLMFACIWESLQTFSLNDRKLQGIPGVTALLHTHSRRLDFHPHIHAVMPAAAIDCGNRLWRQKQGKYLFNHKALAKVFRAKMLAGLIDLGFSLATTLPQRWVVDCKPVGSGQPALVYLGRYLYRGVIREKDIVQISHGQVTFRYRDSQSKGYRTRTVSGAYFLWLVLQHVLPKGFRRVRNYGFLHPNSKTLIKRIHQLLSFDPTRWIPTIKPRAQMRCSCCGSVMRITRTRITSRPAWITPVPI